MFSHLQVLGGMTASPRLERLLSLRWQELISPAAWTPPSLTVTQSPGQSHAALGVAFPLILEH